MKQCVNVWGLETCRMGFRNMPYGVRKPVVWGSDNLVHGVLSPRGGGCEMWPLDVIRARAQTACLFVNPTLWLIAERVYVSFSDELLVWTTEKPKKLLNGGKENGSFSNRQQLKEVKGIGEKTFEQCVGFMRILGPRVATSTIVIDSDDATSNSGSGEVTQVTGKRRKAEDSRVGNKKRKHENSLGFNRLDSTCIHPESYPIAERQVHVGDVSELWDLCDTQTVTSDVKIFRKSSRSFILFNEITWNKRNLKL